MTEEEHYEQINKNAENYLNRTPMQNPIRISSIRSAYITGAIENDIKWHDLRKDPNDLPEDNKCWYLVYLDWLGKKYELFRLCEIKVYKDIVIAWCEIPQFREN